MEEEIVKIDLSEKDDHPVKDVVIRCDAEGSRAQNMSTKSGPLSSISIESSGSYEKPSSSCDAYCMKVVTKGNGKTIMVCQISYCSYESDKNSNFKRHYETMHSIQIPPLQCCDTSFHSKGELRHHCRMVHSQGHECKYCKKLFNRKALLLRHLSVHTGSKPFTCSECNYASGNKSNVHRHMAIHRPPNTPSVPHCTDFSSLLGDEDVSKVSPDSSTATYGALNSPSTSTPILRGMLDSKKSSQPQESSNKLPDPGNNQVLSKRRKENTGASSDIPFSIDAILSGTYPNATKLLRYERCSSCHNCSGDSLEVEAATGERFGDRGDWTHVSEDSRSSNAKSYMIQAVGAPNDYQPYSPYAQRLASVSELSFRHSNEPSYSSVMANYDGSVINGGGKKEMEGALGSWLPYLSSYTTSPLIFRPDWTVFSSPCLSRSQELQGTSHNAQELIERPSTSDNGEPHVRYEESMKLLRWTGTCDQTSGQLDSDTTLRDYSFYIPKKMRLSRKFNDGC